MSLPATEISVSLFRQTLVLPFAIRPRSDSADLISGEDLVAAMCGILDRQQSSRRWLALDDPARHLPDDQAKQGVDIVDAVMDFASSLPVVVFGALLVMAAPV